MNKITAQRSRCRTSRPICTGLKRES